ncbi:MAG: alanine racemase, partial [Bacteroidota bacterium]
SGHKETLRRILTSPEIARIGSVGDSRLSSLEAIKKINPDVTTMYIKPPPMPYVKSVVSVADISLNTSEDTIRALNEEAKKQNKIHKVIIMIELGELREGIMRENVLSFYKNVFELSNIEIVGIGTNLGCMYGVEPTYDKLIQLSLYKQLLEAKFDRKLDFISGGSSITLPLVKTGQLPKTVNHFRIGEAVFLGTSPFDNQIFNGLSGDAFEYTANILELEEKAYIPEGNISEGNVGHTSEDQPWGPEDKSYKAILDFGILDVDTEEITPKDQSVKFFGTTSDLTVYDLGKNSGKGGKPKYNVGDRIAFKPGYMGTARLMHSKFVEKKLI